MIMSLLSRLPIPQRIAGFALIGTGFVLILLGLARNDLRGDILESPPSPASVSLLHSQLLFDSEQQQHHEQNVAVAASTGLPEKKTDSYYVFLQKFPLESSFKKIFHTEVIVCPRGTFKDAAFLNMLDGKLNTLVPSRFDETGVQASDAKTPFASIDKDQWSKQSEPGCVQLGYGGANCGVGCCGSPHKHQNTNYALNSREAVISNAMGDYKELYFYGVSGSAGGDVGGISGENAYKSVCHGFMNAVEMGTLPKCVSNWAGRDYNPLTNNCNTFTSTVLKCVYGLSDANAKPHLGVSDLRNVKCPSEKKLDGTEFDQCLIPTIDASFEVSDKDALSSE
eukprot:CAMPEP_0201629696 /NCGR_PEP_ID=MMETSP0493-20130528/4278_1 /ASSEMBLY_ACC=CAM_ASM_000838 /TAXON_ID=420259 /ORGANISM="Thalassiosira gravida, Strain GMp14c1" /LENGTH=337 /DNA_ID=CAMNT_0048100737 /DNA_START=99 /DNA_END=1112 /DNA_ORIENTATION=-